MSVYFYYCVDLYGTGDWNYHMTQRPPTPQAVRLSFAMARAPAALFVTALQADEELFLVAMQHQIAEHKAHAAAALAFDRRSLTLPLCSEERPDA